MPRYEYKCENCQEKVIFAHSPENIKKVCPFCLEQTLKKNFFGFTIVKKQEEKTEKTREQLARNIKKHIDEARDMLGEQKEEATKGYGEK